MLTPDTTPLFPNIDTGHTESQPSDTVTPTHSAPTPPSTSTHTQSPGPPENISTPPSPSTTVIPTTKPTRTRKIPAKYNDFTGLPTGHVVASTVTSSSSTGMVPKPSIYQISDYLSYDKVNPTYKAFVNSITPIKIPTTFAQAAPHPCWFKAMQTEITALEENYTWEIVEPPPNQHIVDCKWLFRIKYLPDGSVERYKARLVARGFTQTYGLDYFETYGLDYFET
ncbi:hypothetical protein DCAR_0520085 [Daucus carota subsp. sativus]|uniref:Reverse transcriptase Ty1/copia-type domain-containing protein n=1 Tax=Daucus carota subsp. sativus TaxID=79200 RepID=A0AAF1B250_DAUCS|nr:hypothetical protein DCAR_0520085 [Daucus carota subsp. sativus]